MEAEDHHSRICRSIYSLSRSIIVLEGEVALRQRIGSLCDEKSRLKSVEMEMFANLEMEKEEIGRWSMRNEDLRVSKCSVARRNER